MCILNKGGSGVGCGEGCGGVVRGMGMVVVLVECVNVLHDIRSLLKIRNVGRTKLSFSTFSQSRQTNEKYDSSNMYTFFVHLRLKAFSVDFIGVMKSSGPLAN